MIDISIFKYLKIFFTGAILGGFFFLKQALLPLMVVLIILYIISKSNSYRSFEADNEIKIPRWDGVLAIIVITLTILGILFTPSPINNGKFNADDIRQRMEDAGFTDEEIENRISLIESMGEPEINDRSIQFLSLLTDGYVKNNISRPGGGLGPGMRVPNGSQNSISSINIISILSFINKGLIIITGGLGFISALKVKTK